MLSPLRNRFGIPGVISVVALVFAMLGGAYAASNSSDGKATSSAKAKRGPKGPKGATGPAGPAGPAGPQGPAGANGKDGANGSNGATGATGANGTNGTSVTNTALSPGDPNCPEGGAKFNVGAGTPTYACNGKDGEDGEGGGGGGGLPATLPSGKTMAGTWVLKNPTSGISPNLFATLSFPIPLSSADAAGITLADGDIHVTSESSPDPACTGTASEPTAAPGELCVYVGGSEPAGMQPDPGQIKKPDLTEGVGTSGALIFTEELVANGYIVGSFAVTAP